MLPIFGFVCRHDRPLPDGPAHELAWMQATARSGRAAAHLWHGTPGLIVPRSYQRAPNWRDACAQSAALGWPVHVRASGGGLVPQGPGVLNLSLVWLAAALPSIDGTYRALCDKLREAFARLGVTKAQPQPVQGSFCDGRFNLAVDGAKLVGTAQCWRRVEGVQVVLAHALVLVDADVDALTARCNAFEAALGHERRYREQALTNLERAGGGDAAVLADIVIAEQFARVVAPTSPTWHRHHPRGTDITLVAPTSPSWHRHHQGASAWF